MNGQSLTEIVFWDLFSAMLVPALLPTLAVVIFGVLILRRLPKRTTEKTIHELQQR